MFVQNDNRCSFKLNFKGVTVKPIYATPYSHEIRCTHGMWFLSYIAT